LGYYEKIYPVMKWFRWLRRKVIVLVERNSGWLIC